MTDVSAPPGIRIVEAFTGDDVVYVGEAVIAFRVAEDGSTRAITSCGLVDQDAGYVFPDGHVELFGETFDTLEAAAEEQRNREAQRIERRNSRKLHNG